MPPPPPDTGRCVALSSAISPSSWGRKIIRSQLAGFNTRSIMIIDANTRIRGHIVAGTVFKGTVLRVMPTAAAP